MFFCFANAGPLHETEEEYDTHEKVRKILQAYLRCSKGEEACGEEAEKAAEASDLGYLIEAVNDDEERCLQHTLEQGACQICDHDDCDHDQHEQCHYAIDGCVRHKTNLFFQWNKN